MAKRKQHRTLTRQVAVETWLRRGLADFVVQFVTLEHWDDFQPFFIHQGLEKICKAYLIGRAARKYESLHVEKSPIEIDRLARSYGHKIVSLVARMRRRLPELRTIVSQDYDGYRGRRLLTVLEAGYLESRYPVGRPISRLFPIPGSKPKMHWEPLYSSGLEKCAFAISRCIVKAIEKDFGVTLPSTNPFPGQIDDHDWERFCRIFMGEATLCAKCRQKQASGSSS